MKNPILIIFFLISLSVSADKDKWDTNKEQWSPLMLAIYHGQTKNCARLLRQNADVNYTVDPRQGSGFRLTAMEVAIRVSNQKAIKLLVATNKVERLDEHLFTAAAYHNTNTITLLIEHGANPNYANQSGHTVLMHATGFGTLAIIAHLVKNGALVNQAKPNGMTALMLAGYASDFEKLKLLLKLGADKSLRDSQGFTALDYFNKYCDVRKISSSRKDKIRALLE